MRAYKSATPIQLVLAWAAEHALAIKIVAVAAVATLGGPLLEALLVLEVSVALGVQKLLGVPFTGLALFVIYYEISGAVCVRLNLRSSHETDEDLSFRAVLYKFTHEGLPGYLCWPARRTIQWISSLISREKQIASSTALSGQPGKMGKGLQMGLGAMIGFLFGTWLAPALLSAIGYRSRRSQWIWLQATVLLFCPFWYYVMAGAVELTTNVFGIGWL